MLGLPRDSDANKKLEAARKEFEDKLTQTRDGDCVLSVLTPDKCPPPKDSLEGGQNRLSFGDIINGKLNLFCPP